MDEEQTQDGAALDTVLLTIYCCDHYWFYVETREVDAYGPMPMYSTETPVPAMEPGQVAYFNTGNTTWTVLDEDPRPTETPPEEPETE